MAKRKRTGIVKYATKRKVKSSSNALVSASENMQESCTVVSVNLITRKHSRSDIAQVKTYPDVEVYDTNAKIECKYISKSNGLKLSDPNSAKNIPTFSLLEYISSTIKSEVVELKWDNKPSEFYDYEGIIRLKEILTCKEAKDIMDEGREFLFNSKFLSSDSYMSPIDEERLHEFWDMISRASLDEKLMINGISVASDSLMSLMTPGRPVNQEVINQISCILNKSSEAHCCIATNVHEMRESPSNFVNRMKQLFGDSLINVNVLLYMSVYDNSTATGHSNHSTVSSNQHYVFGIYSVDENKVLHVDTKAKPIPAFLFSNYVKLANILGKTELLIATCHEVHAGVDHGKCRPECLYPYQRCNDLGGIAVIIGMCVFALDRKLFKAMTGEVIQNEYASIVSHLRDISSCSHFLKLVVTNWLITGSINLHQIYKKTDPQLLKSAKESGLYLEAVAGETHSNAKCIAEATVSVDNDVCSSGHNYVTKSSALTRICNVSEYSADKDDRLDVSKAEGTEMAVCDMNANKSAMSVHAKNIAPKRFCRYHESCSVESLIDINIHNRQFTLCYDRVKQFLASPPKVVYREEEQSYCIQCCLYGGMQKYVLFKCSKDGREDATVLKEMQEFFTEKIFSQWLEVNQDSQTPCELYNQVDSLCESVTIVLDEGMNMSINCKAIGASVDNGWSELSRTTSPPEDAPTSNIHLPPSKPSVGLKEMPRFSSVNSVKIGCKHGRIPVYFGEVVHLLIGRPTIAFRKEKYYSLECTFYNGLKGYKNFRCNRKKGRDDLEALKSIGEFLKLKNFHPWMKECIKSKLKNKRVQGMKSKRCNKSSASNEIVKSPSELPPDEEGILIEEVEVEEGATHISVEICDTGKVDKRVTSSPRSGRSPLKAQDLDYERMRDYIVGKPKIHYRKSRNMYRIECLLWNGNKVHKKFPCVNTKEQTLKDIQSFLKSDRALNWVQNDDESWIFQYEVKAGVEARDSLDKIPFDITKHFVYDKSIVKPEYSEETSWVSVTESKKWGKTHRFDETYRIIASVSRYNPNTVIAYVYLNCASKTNECRSACGALLSSLTCQDDVCDNCGLSLDTGRKCSHCKTTTSSQWYHKGEPRELCATCYTYKLRKGCDRPMEFRSRAEKTRSKIHHEHPQCRWRMKLEMKLANLNVWNVYEYNENSQYHSVSTVQENKKPSLGVRDTWDRLRLSQKATSLQIHSLESQEKTDVIIKEESDRVTKHPLSQIKARCELVNKRQLVKRKQEESRQTMVDEGYQEENVGGVEATQTDEAAHLEMSERSHNRICGICFEEGINPPFTCNTKRELDAHKNKVHNGCGDLCAICYKEMGMLVRFENSKELMQHLSKHKVKYR